MKNRKLLLIVSLVLALTMSLGGTLAYLTDTDEAVNVMTLGNVKIEQLELQRKDGIDYRNEGKIAKGDELETFEQGQALYPAYAADKSYYSAKIPNDEQFWWGPYVTADVSGDGSSNGLFDDRLVGALDKFVFVKNTGTSDAYFRTWLAFECPSSLEYDGNHVKDLWINANHNSRFIWSEDFYTEIEGVRYLVMCVTYNQPLAAGEIARPSLLQVALSEYADNKDMEALGGTYEILALTQAVQTNNMPGAEAALNAAFGAPTIDNHPWKDRDVAELPSVGVSNVAELNEAIDEGKATIYLLSGDYKLTKDLNPKTTLQIAADAKVTLDLNGRTITGTQHKNDGPVLKNEGTLTVVGGTIKSTAANGGSAIQNSGTITVNDVTLNGAPNANGSWPSYTVNNTGTMELNNSKITSYHGGVASYNEGAIVTLKDCELDMAGIPGFTSHGFYTYTNGKIVINGGTYANKAADQNSTGGSVINGAVEINGGTFSGRIENYYGTPILKGGTFSVNPNAKFVASGYKSVDNGNGTWTVTAE